jgi:hypothetical protein
MKASSKTSKPTQVVASKSGQRNSNADAAMLQAIHDASCHLGASCAVMEADVDPDSGAAVGADKAAALRLRVEALRS